MRGIFWEVDDHAALTAGVRAFLQARYGYTAPAEHTWAATISVRHLNAAGEVCLGTFPFSFVAAGMPTATLEAQIDAECRTRLTALRNAQPLTSILDRRHWL